jgi:hypothetical protein
MCGREASLRIAQQPLEARSANARGISLAVHHEPCRPGLPAPVDLRRSTPRSHVRRRMAGTQSEPVRALFATKPTGVPLPPCPEAPKRYAPERGKETPPDADQAFVLWDCQMIQTEGKTYLIEPVASTPA